MTHSVSISLPASPLEARMQSNNKRVNFNSETIFHDGLESSNKSQNPSSELPKSVNFHSQTMPIGSVYQAGGLSPAASTRRTLDRKFDSFKTFSGRLERQITNLRGGKRTQWETGPNDVVVLVDKKNPSVDRYFDALQGPELDTLRASEEILLPEEEQWPFLLRFQISSFGVCLGVRSQAIMWKALATSASTNFLHLSLRINLFLWCISVFLIALVSLIYLVKLILYFEAVRREYYHPIHVNFFFAPWIVLLFLALAVPPSITEDLPPALWYALMTPIFFLEIKIYGQWMFGGHKRLSKIANPSNHLSTSIVGCFNGVKRRAFCWKNRAIRINFFRGFNFSLAWWAYTFPMTGAAIATVKYSNVVTNVFTKSLVVALSVVATLTFMALLVTTILHAFVFRKLFPNDIAIAISDRKPKHHDHWFNPIPASSDDIDKYLKYADTETNTSEKEASLKLPTSDDAR